jgi:hypothetical protein
MSYGIEIRNSADRIILDNTPYHCLEVVGSGFVPVNTSIGYLTATTNYNVFVAPHTIGTGIYLYPQSTDALQGVSGLDYILVKTMKASTVSGYGLAIYDDQGASNLVFSDNKGFVVFRSSTLLVAGTVGSTVISGMVATSPGRKKYFNIDALYNLASTTVHVWKNAYTFNATETSCTLTHMNSETSTLAWNRATYLNIIEA